MVVTYNDDDSHIGEAEAASDFQWVTNFVLQPGYYEADGEKKGHDRYQRIGEELARTDGVVADEKAAMDIQSRPLTSSASASAWPRWSSCWGSRRRPRRSVHLGFPVEIPKSPSPLIQETSCIRGLIRSYTAESG